MGSFPLEVLHQGVVLTAQAPVNAVRDRRIPVSPRLDPERLWTHRERLHRAALGLCRSREEAEDLVQETYARVLSGTRFLHTDGEYGYLLCALRNTFFSTRRSNGRRPATPAPPEQLEAICSVPDRRDPEAEDREALEALSALPRQSRQVLVAVDLVGLSYPQAARALGTCVGTVKSRLARARAQLGLELGVDAD